MYCLIYILWMLLNGQITAEIALLGILVTVFIAIILFVLFGYTPNRDLAYLKRVPLFLIYILVLILEIIKANLSVFHIILCRKKKVHPYLATFDSGLKSRFARFVLANSITLTPGTITVNQQDDRFTVHCLDKQMMDGITEGTLYHLLKRMEEK